MNYRTPSPLRLLAALGYAAVIFVVSCLAAWISLGRDFYNNSHLLSRTQAHLRKVEHAMQEHINSTKGLPSSLAQLGLSPDELRDPWGKPFHYFTSGTSWSVTSYGRDQKPGGEIWERDLTVPGLEPLPDPTQLYHAENWKQPPFDTFFFTLPTRGVLLWASLAALAAFILALTPWEKSEKVQGSWRRQVLMVLATLVAAWLLSGIICQFHIPSGH